MTYTDSLHHLADADYVIETINEDFDKKSCVFKQLDRIVRSETVLASNTSSIKISDLANEVPLLSS